MDRARVVSLATVGLALLLLVFALTLFVQTKDPLVLIFGIVFALNFVLMAGAIVHALVRDDLAGVQRLIWMAISFFVTPGIALGAIVYFALGRARTAALFRDVGGSSR